jgi:hypothetical protein
MKCLCLRHRSQQTVSLCRPVGRELLCLCSRRTRRHEITNSDPPRPGLRAIKPPIGTLPKEKAPRLVLGTFRANQNTEALCSISLDMGRVVMEMDREPRHLPCLRMTCKNRVSQSRQDRVPRHGYIRLLLMLGRQSARDPAIRRRLLLLDGTIDHGRVSNCCRRQFFCAMLTTCSMF